MIISYQKPKNPRWKTPFPSCSQFLQRFTQKSYNKESLLVFLGRLTMRFKKFTGKETLSKRSVGVLEKGDNHQDIS